jgi:hypothetical protein
VVGKASEDLSRDEIVYPNFLYVGVSKAGSSWIYEILREHPEVFVPAAKDIQFFDYSYERGVDWYLSFFGLGKGKKAVGEIAHDYFLYEETAARIKKHLPDVRLFCCLREPIDQILSTFVYRRNVVLDKKTTLEDFALREEVLHLCDYYYNLFPFYEKFPRENILVLFFDDLKKDSALFARRIYEFLQVDPTFIPESLNKRVLPASEPRSLMLAHLAYKTGLVLRKLGLANIVGLVKRDETFQKLFLKRVKTKPDIPEEVKKGLREYYRERYRHLPELIGQPLPEGWL